MWIGLAESDKYEAKFFEVNKNDKCLIRNRQVRETPLFEFLKSLRGEDVLFAPNPGNAGDSMIAHAEYQLFARAGLSFEIVALDCDSERTRGKTVLYGGGGNLVGMYRNAGEFIEKHHRTAKRLVILPHTIQGHSDLLGQLQGNVEIICRERASYDFVASHVRAANVMLMDDVALGLDVDDVFKKSKKRFLPVFSSPNLLIRNAKRLARRGWHSVRSILDSETLMAFRVDAEKTDIRIPVSNLDVSEAFATDDMSPFRSHEATYRLLKFVNSFKTVHTNRLHVCIASLLLRKNVHLYDNSNGKNGAVFEFSLKDRFTTLTWHG